MSHQYVAINTSKHRLQYIGRLSDIYPTCYVALVANSLSALSTLLILQLGFACSGQPTQNQAEAVVGGNANAGGSVASGGNFAVGGAGGTTAFAGAAAIGGSISATGGSGGCSGTPTLGTVSPAALKIELSQTSRPFLLINVHIPLAGNVPGTDADLAYTNVPAMETFIGADKGKPVVIYCLSDHMALIAGPQLVADGYCNVRYMQGGLSAWQSAGYPVDP